jgi:glycosyltransferase involved in cell wall biosynthesis
VALVTEGTYPHYKGGVSTWCDMLVRGLPEVEFELISLVADPSAAPVFELPKNVARLTSVPLWGIGEVREQHRDLSVTAVLRQKRSASEATIRDRFLGPFRRFVNQIWNPYPDPAQVGRAMSEMADYFHRHDYDETMRSIPVWKCFLAESTTGYAQRLGNSTLGGSLLDVTDAMRLLYRWLAVLTVPIPDVDLIHAASGGLCSTLGVLGEMKGAGFLLTEHGVYLRERLLSLARSDESHFLQLFQANFAQRVTEVSYFYADRITPGSNYNHRWEHRIGAASERIGTIYNGPDPSEFTPAWDHRPEDAAPIVVWLGRIDPLKDLETLIRAAAIVHQQLPKARFVLYGKAPKGNEWYEERCLKLRDELGLRETVIFAGFAASAEAAYNEGDFALLSSISEGFPYSVVEAMMCGRTVVGTDVGGVREALEGCGLVVEPRNPAEMAAACLALLRDRDLCRAMGRMARQKALDHFSVQQCNSAYLATYQRLKTEAQAKRRPMEAQAQLPAYGGLLRAFRYRVATSLGRGGES